MQAKTARLPTWDEGELLPSWPCRRQPQLFAAEGSPRAIILTGFISH